MTLPPGSTAENESQTTASSALRLPFVGVLILGVCATVAFFARAVFTDDIFVDRDILLVYYPLRQFWAEHILRGQFPAWYPYDGLGQPFVGMTISGAFHPSNLLYLAFPPGLALKVNVLVCYPLAWAGAYLLARRWGVHGWAAVLVATLYAFNGYLVSMTNNLLYLEAAATFPWVLWAADRFFTEHTAKHAAAASAILGLVLFAGDAQNFAMASAACGVLAAARSQRGARLRMAGLAAGLLGLTALLTAVQWLPSLAIAPETTAPHRTLTSSQLWSFHPLRFLELLLGPVWLDPRVDFPMPWATEALLDSGMNGLWADSVYLGLPVVLLAMVGLGARRRDAPIWIAIGAAVFVVALMLGKHTPVYGALFEALPPWRAFRYPEKLTPWLMLLLALGAGLGMHRLLASPPAGRRTGLLLASAAACCLLLAAGEARFALVSRFVLAGSGAPASGAAMLSQTLTAQTTATALLSLALGATALLLGRSRLAPLLFVLLIFLGLWKANHSLVGLGSPAVLYRPSEFLEIVAHEEGGRIEAGAFRVTNTGELRSAPVTDSQTFSTLRAQSHTMALSSATGALWGLESCDTCLPAASTRVGDLRSDGRLWLARYAGLYGARYVTIETEAYEQLRGNPETILGTSAPFALTLLRNPTALPRTYLAWPRCARDDKEALRLMTARDFRPGEEAVMLCDGASTGTRPNGAPKGSVKIASYGSARVHLSATALSPCLLVLSDAWYSGWRAEVDGKPVPIERVNHAVRAVRLEPGSHEVVFTFRTPGLVPGLILSGAGIALVLVALAGRRPRGRDGAAEAAG